MRANNQCREFGMPQIGQRVGVKGQPGLFAVIRVQRQARTVDLKLIGLTGVVLMKVQWTSLRFQD
jgi:hypothetical protein